MKSKRIKQQISQKKIYIIFTIKFSRQISNSAEYIKIMGNFDSQQVKLLEFDLKNWNKISSFDNYDVVENDSGEQARMYFLELQQQADVNKEMEIYNYRTNKNGNLVSVKGAKFLEEGFNLCGQQRHLKVLTQRIPYTLEDITNLEFSEAMILLYTCLKNFSETFTMFGGFTVYEKLIGFDGQGNIKLWVHENLSINQPRPFLGVKQTKAEIQASMLMSIYETIEKRCIYHSFPESFRKQLYSKVTFNQAFTYIIDCNLFEEDYMKIAKINIRKSKPIGKAETQKNIKIHSYIPESKVMLRNSATIIPYSSTNDVQNSYQYIQSPKSRLNRQKISFRQMSMSLSNGPSSSGLLSGPKSNMPPSSSTSITYTNVGQSR